MGDRDYAFEALAEVTGTDWTAGRGELNVALKSIREQSEIEDSYLLADEIHARAQLYREVMPDVMLTAPALAKHWKRVAEEAQKRQKTIPRTNQYAQVGACETCSGDRFVWVGSRPAQVPDTDGYPEYSPCPSCNAIEITHYRYDGSLFKSMDPALTRERMQR